MIKSILVLPDDFNPDFLSRHPHIRSREVTRYVDQTENHESFVEVFGTELDLDRFRIDGDLLDYKVQDFVL